MKYTLIALPFLIVLNWARADEFNVSGGTNNIPHDGYVSAGYQIDRWAVEALIQSMGNEEPDTKPGPEVTLELLVYLPSWPVFAKGGPVTGGGGKNGYNVGVGADLPLYEHWSVRTQITDFHVKEDRGGRSEAETIFSVGLRYQF